MYDLLIQDALVLLYGKSSEDIVRASILIKDGVIADIVLSGASLPYAKKVIYHNDKLLTPGLIDCHTHVIYSGNRANELEKRIEGSSYKEISEKGGGILSTVLSTRKATYYELYKEAEMRIFQMMYYGTTTCEIKSGYGLDTDTEVKMLKIASELNHKIGGISIVKTFLAAHAVPKEFKGRKKEYVDYIIHNILPAVAKDNLADFIDAFCEEFAFSMDEIKRIYKSASQYGLKYKLHAEQLSYQKGAVAASNMKAVSVDHLEYLKEEDCKILKQNNTVAVLLPGAFYYLKEKKLPPVEALLSNGVNIAIATDHNPGSSPFLSLPLMMNMACVLFSMTPYQAFRGVTINAAKALNLSKKIGSIEIGKNADLILWNCTHYNQIITNPTYNYQLYRIKNGNIVK